MFELEHSSTVSFNAFYFLSADGICISDSEKRIFKTLIFVNFLILALLGHDHNSKYLLKLENSSQEYPTVTWLLLWILLDNGFSVWFHCASKTGGCWSFPASLSIFSYSSTLIASCIWMLLWNTFILNTVLFVSLCFFVMIM